MFDISKTTTKSILDPLKAQEFSRCLSEYVFPSLTIEKHSITREFQITEEREIME